MTGQIEWNGSQARKTVFHKAQSAVHVWALKAGVDLAMVCAAIGLMFIGLLALSQVRSVLHYAELGRDWCDPKRPIPKVAVVRCDWGMCSQKDVNATMINAWITEAGDFEVYRWSRCNLMPTEQDLLPPPTDA